MMPYPPPNVKPQLLDSVKKGGNSPIRLKNFAALFTRKEAKGYDVQRLYYSQLPPILRAAAENQMVAKRDAEHRARLRPAAARTPVPRGSRQATPRGRAQRRMRGGNMSFDAFHLAKSGLNR